MRETVARTFILVCLLCAILLLITVFWNSLGNTLRQTIPISPLALGRLRNKELESAAENNTRNVTQKPFVILVYTQFFGTKEWIKITDDCSSPEIPGNSCRKDMVDLTYDKKRYAESEFVIFHARDMPGVDHLKTIMKNKPSSQFWIYFLQESPNATPDTRPLNGMFDLTMTYRSDSDFWWPYGSYRGIPFEKTSQLDFSVGKDKLVSWMVSNCNSHLRNSFVHELQKYITVDVFGSCSGKFGEPKSCPHGEACRNIIKQYKFYLSFENALCEDYITEKYWGRIGDENVIPIVLGGANYSKLAIPGSYINVMDFKTVKDLADYLHYLDKNNTAYNEYFSWRQKYRAGREGWSFLCMFCETLRTDFKQRGRYKDLTGYWVGKGRCNEKDERVRRMWS